jgi:triacylglycerol lipase
LRNLPVVLAAVLAAVLLPSALIGCGGAGASPDAAIDSSSDDGAGDDAGDDAADPEPDAGPPDGAADGGEPDGSPDTDDPPAFDPDPVIFVHGINGGSADNAVMRQRLIDDGWPADRVITLDFPDPSWGCNVDNAAFLAALVQDVLSRTGKARVDIVAHSMGGLSSRYYIKNLGGQDRVNTFATLATMHHGLTSPCWSPFDVCVWKEVCSTGEFIAQLNADPATPGQLRWVSMFGTADEDVPNDSSTLEGAENISFPGLSHYGPTGMTEAPEVYAEVKRVLQYPAW